MIIVLNNKCNLTKDEFIVYQKNLENIEGSNEIVLCPSNIFLGLFNSNTIELGSQNVSKNEMGAFTGEVSAKQLKSFNVKYSLVGHSERRKYHYETPIEINKKIKQLLENDITPIYCVGETKEERDNNTYKESIINDIKESLIDIDKSKVIIAYEPIWSIGTGLIPSNEQIEEIISLIKEQLPTNKVIYGGSANDQNINTLKNIKGVDGFLLGGLSLSVENLNKFINKL